MAWPSFDADWTPAQALAVFELINDLREQIWQHYALQIQAQLQQHHAAPRRRRGESILTDQLGHDHVARWRFVAY